jgi:general stress protein 26
MDSLEMKARCLELMRQAADVYFSTVDDDGFPHTRCLFNLRCASRFPGLQSVFAGHDRDLMTYLGTNTSSAKMRHIRANPRVAIYYCEPASFHGVMLSGQIEIVDEPAIRRSLWQKGWEMYYPQGPDDPDFTVLRLFPIRARGWWQAAFEFNLPAEPKQS